MLFFKNNFYFAENFSSIFRVAMVTGLNMETSEELQVANYGIGGHYEPHFDFARVKISTYYLFNALSNIYIILL